MHNNKQAKRNSCTENGQFMLQCETKPGLKRQNLKTLCLFVCQANLEIFSAQLEKIVEKSHNKDWAIRLE